jgi:ankyrin repeat protein
MLVRTLIAMRLALLISLTACTREVADDSAVPEDSSAIEETDELFEEPGVEEPEELPSESTPDSELSRAAQYGDREEIEALLEAGADVNARANDGLTALMTAERNGQSEIAELLKKAGAQE